MVNHHWHVHQGCAGRAPTLCAGAGSVLSKHAALCALAVCCKEVYHCSYPLEAVGWSAALCSSALQDTVQCIPESYAVLL